MTINSNKKIAFFIPSLRGGGAEKMILNLANEFSQKGFKVDLLLCQKEGPYIKDIGINIRIFDFNIKRVLFSIFCLIKYLKKEKPVVMISSLEHVNVIAIIAKLLTRTKTKIVIRVANTMSALLQGGSKYKGWMLLIGSRLFYRFADDIITNSNGSADDLARTLNILRTRIKVIYNPTVTNDLNEKINSEINHLWLKKIISDKKEGFNNNKTHNTVPVIIGVGRLSKQKNFLLLIKAFDVVRKKRNCKLIILGEGEYRDKLIKKIVELELQSDVDLVGFVYNPYAYMARSDVYVLSSLWEGLPNTLIEAMACGTPVVSTDCLSGPREILENGKYGKLVPVGDVNALAQAINDTIDNPLNSQRLRERAGYFSVENAVGKYLEIINE